MDVPHLVLYRNGELTDPGERTLMVEVTGIEVPRTGVVVTLEVETQHGDPDRGGGPGQRIPLWRATQRITNPRGVTQRGVTVFFEHEFNQSVLSGTTEITAPSDYMRYELSVVDAGQVSGAPLHRFDGEYALLLENQWLARLAEVQEASPGAAPDELVVYYCDMFPFQKSIHDPGSWLPREEVAEYVRTELVPRMVEAFRVQSDAWGFPWYHAWTSYRPEEPERLSVALTEGQTWFHGGAPARGHSGISINVKGGENARYETLTDGLMSTYHHELFHNLQRNLDQGAGGDGDVGGQGDVWEFFSEGTAVLASSVGQPAVQLAKDAGVRAYLSQANYFVGGDGVPGDLNRSYEVMSPYHTAIYWRFLYEQCGGMQNGIEDPAAGMRVIRQALMALYSGNAVDIGSSTDLVGTLPEIMEQALSGSACPFVTYEESLSAFARALYALRLDDGRCNRPGEPAGCGLYDPNHVYVDPPLSVLTYTGSRLTYGAGEQLHPAGIPSSYGVDLIDVVLDPGAVGQTLVVEVYGAPAAEAEFEVQVWRLAAPGEGVGSQRWPTRSTAPETLAPVGADGRLSHVIPAIDTPAYNRLGLIITRIDAQEGSDPIGAYTIVLRPGADGDGW
jgi:hypothetical protein